MHDCNILALVKLSIIQIDDMLKKMHMVDSVPNSNSFISTVELREKWRFLFNLPFDARKIAKISMQYFWASKEQTVNLWDL